jgi:predicted nucleic acid-binding protein
LVVDTNILIAAMLKAGTTRNLLFNSTFSLYAPEHITSEIFKYKKEIMEKGKMDENSFGLVFSLVLSQVRIVSKEEFSGKIKEATHICEKHPEDVPFVALALHLRVPVWTHDKAFSKHSEIKTVSTQEIIELFKAQ